MDRNEVYKIFSKFKGKCLICNGKVTKKFSEKGIPYFFCPTCESVLTINSRKGFHIHIMGDDEEIEAYISNSWDEQELSSTTE